MTFSKQLYDTISTTFTENSLSILIRLNAKHSIYEGHFPEQPITPGVVQLAIIKELLAEHLQVKLALLKVNNCKFLAILDPEKSSDALVHIEFQVSGTELTVKAQIKDEAQVYLKLKSSYRIL